jgi:hypothetical protein
MVYLLIYRFTSSVEVEMPICSHWSVDGLSILHSEREMCPWAISKYFGDLVSNTRA